MLTSTNDTLKSNKTAYTLQMSRQKCGSLRPSRFPTLASPTVKTSEEACVLHRSRHCQHTYCSEGQKASRPILHPSSRPRTLCQRIFQVIQLPRPVSIRRNTRCSADELSARSTEHLPTPYAQDVVTPGNPNTLYPFPKLQASQSSLPLSLTRGRAPTQHVTETVGERKATPVNSLQAQEEIEAVIEQLDRHFLSPVEQKILTQIKSVSSSSRFQKPVIGEQLQPSGVPINWLKQATNNLTADEKLKLYQSLDELLDEEQRTVLRRLKGSNEAVPFIQADATVNSRRLSRRLSTTSVEHQRPFFWPDTPSDEERSNELPPKRLHLRGGGNDGPRIWDIFRAPSLLPDDARIPTNVWYFAGGMGRPPKAGDLRRRRAAEIENRRRVGFWGTVLGIRVPQERKRPKTAEEEAQSLRRELKELKAEEEVEALREQVKKAKAEQEARTKKKAEDEE